MRFFALKMTQLNAARLLCYGLLHGLLPASTACPAWGFCVRRCPIGYFTFTRGPFCVAHNTKRAILVLPERGVQHHARKAGELRAAV